jgi:hypothetical protein
MKPEQVGLSIGIGILLASIFFVGVQMALGFTPWLLYVIPLGRTYWIFHLYAPAVVATLCTLLMFVGYDLSPPLVAEHVALTNRTFGAITFGPLAFLIVASKLLGQRLSRLTDQLRMKRMERTQDLSRAVSALRAGTQQRNSSERNQPEASDEFTREVTEMLAAEGWRLSCGRRRWILRTRTGPRKGMRTGWIKHAVNWKGWAGNWNRCSATCSARESLSIGGTIVREGCVP